jgi:hypothetical protein
MTGLARGLACIAFALVGWGAIALASADGPIRAMRWLAPGADKVRAMTTRPAECLAMPRAADAAYAVEVGRAAFRTPILLGGQAARAGVSCETCHKGGHTNVDFDFPGVSGAPGTADVTDSLFSSHRGDGIDNPKPIPDLGGPKTRLKVDQAPQGRALETFIHGLVTQEFDGPEPPAQVLDGLAAYVRALTPDACPRARTETIRAEAYVEDARRAVRTARLALARGDHATAALMIGSARTQLGAIYERYDGPALAADRDALKQADAALATAAESARDGDPKADERLAGWLDSSRGWAARIGRDEPKSLFEPTPLAVAAGIR